MFSSSRTLPGQEYSSSRRPLDRDALDGGAEARVVPREEVVDADFAWIRDSLKATQYVGDVLTRRDQYLNKVMSLKRKFPSGRERDYAAGVELLIERLRLFPMQAMLRDVLRDDPQLRKIRFLG